MTQGVMMNPPKHRIAILTDCLWDVKAGAEKQIVFLATSLDKSRYDVHVISLDKISPLLQQHLQHAQCRVSCIRVVRIYDFMGFVRGWQFQQYLKEHRIHTLMTFHFGSDIWGGFWGRAQGVKHIFSNRRDMGFWRKFIHNQAYLLVKPFFSGVITVAEAIKEVCIKRDGWREDEVAVIPNAVNLPQPQSKDDINSRLDFPQDVIIGVIVANIKPIKGHRFLLQAVKLVQKECPLLRIICVGDDREANHLREEIIVNNLQEYFILTGPKENVHPYLERADFCLLTSLSEGMSNALLEYMSHAKAIIASDVGGNKELIHDGVNGFLYGAEDVNALAKAIVRMYHDKTLRENMGQAGLRKVKDDFTPTKLLYRYEEILSRINVLHVISTVGLYGAENMLLNLFNSEKRHRHGLIVLAPAWVNDDLECRAKALGVRVYRINSDWPLDLITLMLMQRIIKNDSWDVVHSHNYKSNVFVYFLSLLNSKFKWVSTVHGWLSSNQKVACYENLDRWVLRKAHQVIPVADNQVKILIHAGVKSNRILPISNGIVCSEKDPNHHEFQREQLGYLQSDCVILMVGRLSKEKGFPWILEAFEKAHREHPYLKLCLVGGGDMHDFIQDWIKQKNLSAFIRMEGQKDSVREYYAMADIFLNASLTEGLPMTILEAMSASLPIIATKVGQVPQVIKHGSQGLLINSQDEAGFLEAIAVLGSQKALRLKMGTAGNEHVRQFYNAQIMSKRYAQVYEQVFFE